MVEAVARQGVGEQAVFFHGLVAGFTQAGGAFVHTLQCRVDFAQQGGEAVALRREGDGLLQAALALFELPVQECHFDGGHGEPPRVLAEC
jgi:hypothetical protein